MTKSLILACALLLGASAAGGCNFYGDGDDAPCALYDPASGGFRNPVNGACESAGGGGCDDIYTEEINGIFALPDWAVCPGECEALDEATCLATPACRAAYQDDSCPPWADCAPPANPSFLGCWGTAPSGPVQGGGCDSLDALACSRHDDCTAHYTSDWGEGGTREDGIALGNVFSYCADEEWGPGCYSDLDCPAGWECSSDVECLPPPRCETDGACEPVCYGRCQPAQNGCEAVDCAAGYHCELQCLPSDPFCYGGGESLPPGCDGACEVTCVPDQTWGCEAILCGPGTHCETVCADLECAPGADCPAQCWSDCVGDVPDPGTCDGEVWCDALPPSCPVGTVPGISNFCWSGYCIPEGDCGPNDPGECSNVVCDLTAPPACPTGTVPGVRDCHHTGYCIPAWLCEADQSCASLADEASCAARTDCQPVYQGAGCTCYPDGSCSCEDWAYLRCESWGDAPVMPF